MQAQSPSSRPLTAARVVAAARPARGSELLLIAASVAARSRLASSRSTHQQLSLACTQCTTCMPPACCCVRANYLRPDNIFYWAVRPSRAGSSRQRLRFQLAARARPCSKLVKLSLPEINRSQKRPCEIPRSHLYRHPAQKPCVAVRSVRCCASMQVDLGPSTRGRPATSPSFYGMDSTVNTTCRCTC